ncbi:hypothetical protein F2Q70_00014181 [Brassica cretica]|uniref:VAN3-binding protein-like auxin canalisation domain-containing protein n=1 Tax=Brassica cretica TaxID=69181 RepID=A0A8S9L4G7_BRACR|nr:hypothetical protein F2Q70_00014181 [Brassica cretica]KAF2601052.1 hypothetical protein F2Q68_00007210 [Brassica cretica]
MRNPKRKDKERVERARVHSAVSIAALAAGLASVTSSESCSKESGLMMTLALASATELLASHCIEMAEQAGADRECVAATEIKSSRGKERTRPRQPQFQEFPKLFTSTFRLPKLKSPPSGAI